MYWITAGALIFSEISSKLTMRFHDILGGNNRLVIGCSSHDWDFQILLSIAILNPKNLPKYVIKYFCSNYGAVWDLKSFWVREAGIARYSFVCKHDFGVIPLDHREKTWAAEADTSAPGTKGVKFCLRVRNQAFAAWRAETIFFVYFCSTVAAKHCLSPFWETSFLSWCELD